MSAETVEIEEPECRKACFGGRFMAVFRANSIRQHVQTRHSHTEKAVNTPSKGRQQSCKRWPFAARKATFYTSKDGRALHTWQADAGKVLVGKALLLHTLYCDICRQTACFSE